MANIGTISFDVTANISGLEMAANSTNTKLESIASTATRVSDSLGKAGKKMTAAVTAPALAVGGLAINEFAKFETAMNNVNVIARESDADFANTTESIKDMAIEMGKQPVDLADALFNLNSAGFKGKAGLDVLNVASKSAVGGLVSTELAAKSISSSLNAYGLSSAHASDAADVLFKTNELGVTTFAELASNMGKVLPTANSLGVDLGQVGAAMATMTRGGIGTAEATTSLNQVLLKILKPTKEMGDVFAATEHKTGAAMIAAEGLSGVLKLVRESAIAAGEGAKPLEDGLGKLGFTETALLGINSLLRDNMQEFTNDLEAVATSAGRAGAAQDAFDKNSQGVARRLAELKALVTVTAIEIADVLEPAFTASVETVRSVVAWFRNLDESYRTIIVSAVAVAAAVGPILVGLGFLVGLIPSIIAGFTAMSGAVAFLSGIAPVALAVVAAIAAVGFAVKQVADEFDLFGESAESNFADWETIWERMKALPELFVIEAKFAFENFFAIVDNVFGNIGIIVVNWWNETAAIFDFMGESWENVLSVMSVTFDTYIDNISKRFGLLKDLLTGNIGIGDFAKQFGELQLNPFKGLTENIKKELAIEIPVKVPLRDLGSELAAIADRKDAALEAAMAINTEAISHQTEKTEEAAMAAEEQAASGSGVGAEAMATAEQSAAAVEAGSVAAFSALNRRGKSTEEEQLAEAKKLNSAQIKVIRGQAAMVHSVQQLTNNLEAGGI